VFLTEIMPADVRVSGFSVSYSLATGIFGGFTPAVSTWLIHETGNSAMPGAWMAFAGLMSLVATLVLTSRSFQRRTNQSRQAVDAVHVLPIGQRKKETKAHAQRTSQKQPHGVRFTHCE